MPHPFCRYELRATDVEKARAFYDELFGPEFWRSGPVLSQLPAQAAARGAPPNWLGHIAVEDPGAVAAEIVADGGQLLGPAQPSESSPRVIVRDPFGAIVALAAAPPAAKSPVVWHFLHSQDEERSFAWYARLFGWTSTGRLDLGPERGRHVLFTWDASDQNVGAVANTVRLPAVHPHWFYGFPVPDLEAATAVVRSHGGKVLPTVRAANGDLVAPIDDPQGAALGLFQFATG